jgi:hypothetical protein
MNRKDRLTRARDRIEEPVASLGAEVPGPSEDYAEYMEFFNAERRRIDAADRAALDPAERADLTFGDDPSEATEPEADPEDEDTRGEAIPLEDFYLALVLQLRSEIDDDHPKAPVMDRAIEVARDEQQLAKGYRREQHDDEA